MKPEVIRGTHRNYILSGSYIAQKTKKTQLSSEDITGQIILLFSPFLENATEDEFLRLQRKLTNIIEREVKRRA